MSNKLNGTQNVFLSFTDAVKRWDKKATEHDVQIAVSHHLKHAPGRSGGGGYSAAAK